MKISTILATHDKTDLVILLLRITTGSVFMAHSVQKLFGQFGGNSLEATGQWINSRHRSRLSGGITGEIQRILQ